MEQHIPRFIRSVLYVGLVIVVITACKDNGIQPPFDPIKKYLFGTVIDHLDNPLADVVVDIYHQRTPLLGVPDTTLKTDGEGEWYARLNAGLTYTLVFSKSGYPDILARYFVSDIDLSDTLNMGRIAITPLDFDALYRVVLTWGASPADLDAHLTGPKNGNERFHLYWDHRVAIGTDGDTLATLDVDRRSGFGPETITIYNLSPGPEPFRYTVHNYSADGVEDSKSLAMSEATVRVFDANGLQHEFKMRREEERPDSVGNAWRVFEIDTESGEIVPVDSLIDGVSFDDHGLFKLRDMRRKENLK